MIEQAIGYTALAWVLIQYTELICDKALDTKHERLVANFVCLKCWAFWLSLFISFDLYTSSIAGMIGYILDAFVLKKKIEL